MAIPTSPFDPAKSIFAGLCVVQIKIGATTYVFESKMLKHTLEQEIKHIEHPDAAGVLRRVRSVITKQFESWKFEMDEAKRVLDLFGNALAGRAVAEATLWIPDPDDASGLIALKSEVLFACFVTRDGDMDFGNSEFTKATITIESNKAGAVTFTPDASTA